MWLLLLGSMAHGTKPEQPADPWMRAGRPATWVSDPQQIVAVAQDVRAGAERVTRCAVDPTGTGVVMGLTVRDGRATDPVVKDGRELGAQACLLEVLPGWPFPSVTGEVQVVWTFGPEGPVPWANRGASVATERLTLGDRALGPEDALHQHVRRFTGQVRYCVQRAQVHDALLAGTLDARWTVEGGAARDVSVTGLDGVAPCVAAKIARWSFAAELSGEVRWTVQVGPG